MKKIFIKDEIKIILETLHEQYLIIDEHENKIPQIEIDIILTNIQKLYELFYDLNKLNNQYKNSINANIAVNFENKTQKFSIEKENNAFSNSDNETIENPIEMFSDISETNIQKNTNKIETLTEKEISEKNNSSELNSTTIEGKTDISFIEEYKIETTNTLYESTKDENIPKKEENTINDIFRDILPEKPKTMKPEKKTTVDLFSSAEKEFVADKFKESPKLIHDKITKDNSENTLANKVGKTSITNLKNAIGINDKFLFINELFKGDLQEYNKTIDILNTKTTIEESNKFIEELKEKYIWNDKLETIQKLEELIIRKFL
ncbi:MAG: hypothetical protein WCQ95_01795 [Bacteroidota bacterium]